MTRQFASVSGLGLIVGAALIVGCTSTAPEIKRTPRPVHESGRWTRAWPAGMTDVYVNARADCVFLDGVMQRVGDSRVRVVQCVDPVDGSTRWSVEHAAAADRKRGRGIFFADKRMILRDGHGRYVAYATDSGAEVWRLEDKAGRALYRAFLVGGELVVDIGNETLVRVDATTGEALGACPIKAPLAAVVDGGGEALVAIEIVVDDGDPSRGTLRGARIDQGCGEEPPPALWSVSLEKWSDDIVAVGGALVGEFFDGELTAIDPTTGTRLWTMKAHQLGDKLLFSKERIIVAEANVPASNPAFEGSVLKLRGIHPAAVEDRSRMWELEVPTDYDLLGVEGGTDEGRAFAATADRFFVYDAGSGKLEWSYHISPGASLGWWSTASANAEAVFVFFEREGKAGTLQRIPIVLE